MRFSHLEYIWLLGIIPLVLLLLVWSRQKKKQGLRAFADVSQHPYLLKPLSRARQRLKSGLQITVLGLVVVALLGPQWGYDWQEVKKRGVDIVVAIDVSKSMLAEDIKPNRLERTKKEVERLISVLRGDRIAIVAFAGNAFIQCPLTTDYGVAKLFLSDLNTDSLPLGGTDIGRAIEKSLEAYDKSDLEHRVLILISDGEDHGGEIEDAIERAQKEHVAVYPVLVGSVMGAPIPIFDNQGNRSYIKDQAGLLVLSKQNPEMFSLIAAQTGTFLSVLGSSGFALEDVYSLEIDRLEKKEFQAQRNKQYHDRFTWFVLGALTLYMIEMFIPESKKEIPRETSSA